MTERKIKELWTLITKTDTGDGIVAIENDGVMVPMICDNAEYYEMFAESAQRLADENKTPLEIAHFGNRRTVAKLKPK